MDPRRQERLSVLSLGEYLRQTQAKPPLQNIAAEDCEKLPAIDIARKATEQEAWQRGYEAGQSEAARLHAEEIAALERAFAAKLESERDLFANELTTALLSRHSAAIEEFIERIGTVLVRVLSPFVAAAGTERMLAEFARVVHELASDPDHPPMTLSGPQEMIDRLAGKLDAVTSLSVTTGMNADLVLSCGTTRIEARIDEWMAKVPTESEN